MGPMGHVTGESCHMTIYRSHIVVSIEVEFAKIEGTKLGKRLITQLETWKVLPRGKVRNKPILDLVYQTCLPVIQQLVPDTSLDDLSLEGFLHTPTYNLEVVGGNSDDDIHVVGAEKCLYLPGFNISPMPTTELPEIRSTIPQCKARDVYISPLLDERNSVEDIQGRVTTADGVAMYFKPRMDIREAGFARELLVLTRIHKIGLAARLRVPKLHGLVVSDEGTVIGILITMITPSKLATTLRSPGLREREDMHKKWEDQLTFIVKELHAHDIVWGDVHPMNVIIDEDMNAWAIDFNGSNNAMFIDDENRETEKGDWQGMNTIFKTWLPDPEKR